MKKYLLPVFLILLFSSCSILDNKSAVSASSRFLSVFPETAEKVLPSVVQVTVIDLKNQKIPEGWDFSYNPFAPSPDSLKNNEKEFQDQGLGSGIVAAKRGNKYYILTNKHVLGEAEKNIC